MIFHFKITQRLIESMRNDFQRPHRFAYERIGFLTCRFAVKSKGNLFIFAHQYYPVTDEDYIEDHRYGAVIGSGAFQKAMQMAYSQNAGIFHIHLHLHEGKPTPSEVDIRATKAFVPDFFHVRPNLPHGALILSLDSISGRIWLPESNGSLSINRFTLVGAPLYKMEV